MKNDEIVTEAISHFQDFGPPTHTWDEIAPETEHVEAQLVEEGYESECLCYCESRFKYQCIIHSFY